MQPPRLLTGTEAGLSGDEQIRIALRSILAHGGTAQIADLYHAVEQHMDGARLSDQGKASLRFFINKVAVRAGYIYPADPTTPGWRITPEGREASQLELPIQEEAVNVDTAQPIQVAANSVRGAAFELYILRLLKELYPHYAWYHQGQHKGTERGLDFIGSRSGGSRIARNLSVYKSNSIVPQLPHRPWNGSSFLPDVSPVVLIKRCSSRQDASRVSNGGRLAKHESS